MSTPTTPTRTRTRGSDGNIEEEQWPDTTCEFMPQASTPLLIMSSRPRKHIDQRKSGGLMRHPEGVSVYDFDQDKGESSGDDEEDLASGTVLHVPVTVDRPKTLDSSSPLSTYKALVWLSLAVIFSLLMIFAGWMYILGLDEGIRRLWVGFMIVVKVVESASEAFEMCLYGTGFIFGRAAAKFGKGFAKGFNM